MAAALIDPTRAPVAFGRRAVPQLFEELQQPEAERRLPALASLCDLMHDPERLYQTVNGGKGVMRGWSPQIKLLPWSGSGKNKEKPAKRKAGTRKCLICFKNRVILTSFFLFKQ